MDNMYRKVPYPYHMPMYEQQVNPSFIQNQPVNQMQGPVTPYQYYQKPLMPIQQDTSFPQVPMGKQPNPFVHYFQDKNGEMDFDKVFQTVNQLASTYNQVSPIFKNVGSFLKAFQK
ncbi:YppG family protein [Gracilibacillus sp. YIM 98692]|uniref:YppG family protein n=1 Tax=Gracilibacillus sp. YIM 98692 TaxID=2663532 RepID=UPI0013CFC3C9|nr:YppG family protein [Gracilibacillus sp. YIM 98692]